MDGVLEQAYQTKKKSLSDLVDTVENISKLIDDVEFISLKIENKRSQKRRKKLNVLKRNDFKKTNYDILNFNKKKKKDDGDEKTDDDIKQEKANEI